MKADYTYHALERMAVRTTQNMTPSGTTHYIYDRAGRLLTESTGTGTVQREYVWIDDMPLALFADLDTGTPKQFYIHPDHLDRPTKMTDATKAVVWDAYYWPFGEVRSITGSATLNLRFPGHFLRLYNALRLALNHQSAKVEAFWLPLVPSCGWPSITSPLKLTSFT